VAELRFFAVDADLLPVFRDVEARDDFKYLETGHFPKTESLQPLTSGADIPRLSSANCDSGIACDSYLISYKDTVIAPRPIDADVISIDQLWNPDTVTLTPGGAWSEAVVLYGRLATASDSERAQKLMKLFGAATRRAFTRVGDYFVGPSAMEWLKSGKRLTIAVQSPPEFDLRLT
jgi:hypothetical protein